MVSRIFSSPELDHKLIKAIINIAYQVESAKFIIADSMAESTPKFLPRIILYSEDSFLLTRLLFILSVDQKACEILSDKCKWLESTVVASTISSFTPETNEKGIETLLNACNFRYLQTTFDHINHRM